MPATEAVRSAAIDLGSRRIGLAVSDSRGTLATPRCTVQRSGDAEADRAAVVAVIVEAGAEHLIVGLPLSLDGRRRQAAMAAEEEAAALRALLGPLGVAVETFDERLTTVSAERSLAAAGHGGKARRRVVDQVAAAVLLQAWLDAQR
ncbi:MAG TPA: Holliday junction resolvase RuvX [Acidimicrobiales bacterium]|nr:Holliday junction resolvase RuvX [Acidimicrobiales bacterium]